MSFRNPYTNRTTIYEESDFYGRKKELRDIYSRIRGGQSVSLVGERRSGKSSLLQALNFAEQRRRFRLPEEIQFLHLDLQYVAESEESEFLECLLDAAEEAFGIEAGPPKRSSLRRLAKEVVRARGQRLVVCLDEFDILLNNRRIGLDFFAYLRAWSNEYRISFVGASREGGIDRMLDSSATGSAFLNVFGSVYVGPFSKIEAEELIRLPALDEGVNFSNADVERVVLLAGFHPYYLQIACSYLFDLRQANASGSEVDQELRRGFGHEALDNLRYLFGRLSRRELKTLRSLALGGEASDSSAVFYLEQKGILMEWRGRRRIFSRTFKELLQGELAELAASNGGLEGKVDESLLENRRTLE